MRKLMIQLVGGLAFAIAMLAGGAGAMAAEPGGPSAAPMNPEFVQYLQRVAAGAPAGMTEDGHGLGAIPGPLDLSHTAGQTPMAPGPPAGLPASYDLRNIVGKLPPIRDQGQCGSCWAFATYGSLESYLLPPETWDFSEMDLICEHGFDYTQCIGGQHWMSTAYLGRWDGPVTEACYPYAAPPLYNCTNPRPVCAVQKHVQEVDFVPDRADNTIKTDIMTYGAVYTTMYMYPYPPYYDSSKYAYYYNGSNTLNHAVCIVGWDDNYAAANFLIVPPGNGAFIIRNSWGLVFGQAGYFYVSYFDTRIGRDNAMFRNAEATNNYFTKYEYDPLGWVSSVGYGSTTAWGANIFTAVAGEDLVAVTTYAASVNTTYDVYVYLNANAGPTSGALAAGFPQTGTFASPGYQRIVLSPSVALTNGQKFSIVLKLTTPGYNWPVPFEYPLAGYSSAATANAGESYISNNGVNWQDITTWTANSNVCIKGFTGEPTALTKWKQNPDTTYYGMDIRVDSKDGQKRVLADDFKCIERSLLTDVHFWGSWMNDMVGQITNIHLSIHSDDPVGLGGSDPYNTYSKPDLLLWHGDFTTFMMTLYRDLGYDWEWWWDPVMGVLTMQGDHLIWKIDIDIPPADAFLQTGTMTDPVIYWLDIMVDLASGSPGQFGWKTRTFMESHSMDDAVWAVDDGVNPIAWNELRYPLGHPLYGNSIDMAFELTFQEPPPQQEFDFGDAPDSALVPRYPTLLANGGANHVLGSGLMLGNVVDAEADGQPTVNADGDDLNPPLGIDDEDGVTFNAALFFGVPNNVTVVVTDPAGGGALLNAWIDFNGNGSWADPGEQIFTNVLVSNGTNSLTFTPGAIKAVGQTFARFRLSYQGGLSYTGQAPDGEVEDYMIPIVPVKWLQRPDTSTTGVDVGMSEVELADDFRCIMSGPITDIHIWTSFRYDELPQPLNGLSFMLKLYADVPVGTGNPYSHPGTTALWSRTFPAGGYNASLIAHVPGGEWWHDPEINFWMFPGDWSIFQYDFYIPEAEAYVQNLGTIYWLGVKYLTGTTFTDIGWKSSLEHWNDDAVWLDSSGIPTWRELRYGGEHPMVPDSMDLAFAITTPCPQLQVVSAKSVKNHGTAGTYGIEGSSTETGQKSIECRSRGSSPAQVTISKVVTVFNQAITRINNNNTDISVNSGTIGTISVTTTTVSGDTLVVAMTNVPDNAVFRIGFPGIAAACDQNNRTAATKCWKVIRGDYNASGTVTVQNDVVPVRNLVGKPLNYSATAFRADYDCSGSITVQNDVVPVRNRVGTPGNCPGCTCPP